jgi:hypothetical protein
MRIRWLGSSCRRTFRPVPGTRHILSPTIAALACLLALSSCGGDDGDGAASESSSTTSMSESSTTTEDSTTTSATSSTTTTAPVPPEPADGHDVSACADASCDVEVTLPIDLPLDPTLNVGTVTLSAADAQYLGIQVVTPDGTTATIGTGVGGSATLGPVHLRVVALEGQTARLILAPCGETEGCQGGRISNQG